MVVDTNESFAQEQSSISAVGKGVDTQLLINLMEQQSGPFDFTGAHEILGRVEIEVTLFPHEN